MESPEAINKGGERGEEKGGEGEIDKGKEGECKGCTDGERERDGKER